MVLYPPTYGLFAVVALDVACALKIHPASSFACPFTTRDGSWHARHNCELELSRTRNFASCLSIFWKCGWWQVVHSMVPLIMRTAGSAVCAGFCCSSSERLGASTRGCLLYTSDAADERSSVD